MKFNSLVAILAVAILVCVSGCASVNDDRNELLVQLAVSQGVARYIDAGVTDAEDELRRERVIEVLSVVRQFVVSDESFDPDTWSDEFVRLIDFDSLSAPDQMLVMQLLTLVRQEIDARVGDSDVRIFLSGIVDVAIEAAVD